MLSAFDDYPIHQTSQPIAIPASGDLNHYDRYFFNGYTADASLYFGVALGMYPNREVVDGAFSVVRGGEQVSVYASGRCPADRRNTIVGPIHIEIIEPMRVLRVVVDAPEQGLQADLTFRARTAPIQEPPFFVRQSTRTVMDYTRLTQFGDWEGSVSVDGELVDCSRADVLGSRDRSWGIRPVGERVPGAPGPAPQFYWLWAPVSFGDVCTHFDVNERADGTRWHEAGFIVPVGDEPAEAVAAVDYRLTWERGTRRVESFSLALVTEAGETHTVTLEPMLHFAMKGIGYTHPEWRHGCWKGELVVGGDRWSLPPDPADLANIHLQTLCRATMGDRVGTGILEQLVVGSHAPTGLTGLFDGA
ncbi:MAG TPA: hypothetical protein VF855_03915 [Acidimicrobiales bacterium]